jgi:hypothetical protein
MPERYPDGESCDCKRCDHGREGHAETSESMRTENERPASGESGLAHLDRSMRSTIWLSSHTAAGSRPSHSPSAAGLISPW